MTEPLLVTRRHIVLVEEPHNQSLAALVMLTHFYRTFEIEKWLNFRFQFLTEHLSIHGDLVCHYCGKDNLKIESERRKEVATLDHVYPRSKGGAEYDKKNLVISCTKCNEKKGDKVI